MRVQTNAGEVELTAKMVRPGMVVGGPDGWRHVYDGKDPRWSGVLADTNGGGAIRMVGCDPAIAAREDVERYGVAPGIDAGAHGFARLRDGGAVDLRRPENIRHGMVFVNDMGERFVAGRMVRDRAWARADANGDCDRADLTQWRFVSLDATYAAPEDVERLCCGNHQTEQILDGYVGRTATGNRCTLAIGDHDEHEDLATGVRWKAEQTDIAIRGPLRHHVHEGNGFRLGESRPRRCPGCGVAEGALCAETCPDMQRRRAEWEATHCGARPKPGQRLGDGDSFTVACGDERCRRGKDCDGRHEDSMRSRHGVQWTDDAPIVACSRCGAPVIPTAERPTMGVVAQDETGAFRKGCLCEACAAVREDLVWREGRLIAVAEEQTGLGAVALLAWCCAAEGFRERERRAREAPLAALVNACPEGLDPIGWTAAVLAMYEPPTLPSHIDVAEMRESIAGMIRRGAPNNRAVVAYQRAIAPQGPRPKVEWRRGGKDVRIAVDDGRDD